MQDAPVQKAALKQGAPFSDPMSDLQDRIAAHVVTKALKPGDRESVFRLHQGVQGQGQMSMALQRAYLLNTLILKQRASRFTRKMSDTLTAKED
jgi:hypothetical protein